MKADTRNFTRGMVLAQTGLEIWKLRAERAGRSVQQSIGGSISKVIHPTRTFGNILSGLGSLASSVFGGIGSVIGTVVGGLADLARKALLMGTALAGVAVVALADCVRHAIALGEQSNRTKVVFGDFAGDVIRQSELMARAFGVSKTEFLETTSAMGQMFKGAGYDSKAASQLAVHFARLGQDLSSISNVTVAEALQKIQSGLSGEAEPLRRFGANITEANVKAYAYAHGLARMGAELTDAQKIQGRIGLITEKLAYATGDLANTADEGANAVRSLSGRFENLKGSIGESLLKFLVPALQDINVGINAIQMAWDASKTAALAASGAMLGGAKSQAESVGLVQKAVMFAVDAWQSFKIAAIDAMVLANKSLVKLLQGLRSFTDIYDKFSARLGMTTLSDNLEDAIGKVLDLQRALVKMEGAQKAAPKASIAVADAFAKAREDIKKARAELAGGPALDVNKVKPTEAAAAKVGAPKYSDAHAAGTREATNAILKARYGTASTAVNEPAKQTAQNTRRTVDLLTQAVGKLDALAQRGAGNIGALFAGNF